MRPRKIDRTRTRKEDRPELDGGRMNDLPAAPAAAAATSTSLSGENTLPAASLEQENSSNGKPKRRNRKKAPNKTPADKANKKQPSKRAAARKKDRSDKDEGPAMKRPKKTASSKSKKRADYDDSTASSKSKKRSDKDDSPTKKKKRAEEPVEEKKRDDDDSFDSADDQISDETKDDSNDENYEDDLSRGDEEEDVEENESSESEDFVPTKRKARGRTARTKPATGNAKRSSRQRSADGDNDSSSESDAGPARRSKRSSSNGRNRSQSATTTRARRSQSSDDEIQAGALDDTDSEDINIEGASTPRRASARKASRKMALLEREEEKEEEEEHSIPKTRRRSKAAAKDDEEYNLEDEAEEESDEDLGSADDDEESSSGVAERASAIGVVKDDEVGTAEDSSSDDDEGAVGTRWQSPELKVQRSPKKRPSRRKPAALDDSSSDSVDSPPQRLSTSPPKLPPCPSEFDVITFEPLPAKHVCYFPPGNGDRQCFALETLRKIGLSTAHPKFREALTGGSQTFLQPPAFRTAMSDDLLDQIASRFGREALNLHGPFYNRSPSKPIARVDGAESDSETYGDALDESTAFIEQVRNYVHAQMGSKDIYACPLCYTVAHKRLESSGKRRERLSDSDCDDETLKERYPATDLNDPMLVLGAVDNDVLEVASAFCFFKVANLKRHLRNDHHVETKNIKGNEFYETFKIRKVDGLLQRYLKKSFRSVNQGDMQRYWFEGNNFTFVHLLNLIPHSELCREIVETHDHSDIGFVEKAEVYLQPAYDFFESFASIAPKLWKIIIEPFRELTQEDVKDFIDNENGDKGDEAMTSYRALAMEQELESLDSAQERAAYYVNRMKESQSRDDLEDSSQKEDGSDDLASSQGELEESSEEEEDEWEHKIKSRRGSIGKRTPSKSRSTQTSRRSSLDEDLDQKPPPKGNRKLVPERAGDDSPRSASRRRVVIEDSDEN